MKHIFRLLRAATKKANKDLLASWFHEHHPIELPSVCSTRTFSAGELQVKRRQFDKLHHWSQTQLHPCFPLFLGITQHIDTLTDEKSPFSLMGLVHTDNLITQYAALSNDTIHSHCYFDAIRLHPRGIVVDIVIDFSQAGQVCQRTRSTYLYRQTSDRVTQPNNQQTVNADLDDASSAVTNEALTFEGNAGRRYARFSGDYNPIHLFNWSAKLFGFKSVMAHGTHVLAKTLSAIQNHSELPEGAFTLHNQFQYPVPLPSKLALTFHKVTEKEESVSFSLKNPNAPKRKQELMWGSLTESS